jgi:UDP-N-acetylglucosamine--N-acetylmuramyl-(pentapeptide) pyrophosphoryl-undecaprenol N-acetylglucosamine transferase
MILLALPLLAARPWQWVHLAGASDEAAVRAGYAQQGIKAVVKPFFSEMDLALGAATAAVSRAGASSLAEIAACRLPSLLVPFPAAAENHQFFNARAFVSSGAALLEEQKTATPETVAKQLTALVEDGELRQKMQFALGQWHAPQAAEQIALHILEKIAVSRDRTGFKPEQPGRRSGQPAERAQQAVG